MTAAARSISIRSATTAPLVVAALLSAACRPATVLWSGRTPDRNHHVEVIRDGGVDFLVVDGRRRAAHRAIAVRSLEFSADGHLAFAARRGDQWVVVRDGRVSEPWNNIGEVALAPNGRLAYAGERDGGWYVVVDSIAGPRFDAILADTLRFSRDGRRVAYVGQTGRRVFAVVDGVRGPGFDGIGQLSLSDDGAHAVYAARRGRDAHLVVDGVIGPAWRAISHIEVEAGRVAYAARDSDGWRVIVDGEPGPTIDRVERVVVRDDGRHVAWVGRVGDRDILAVDDIPVVTAPSLRDAAVDFTPATPGPRRPGLSYVKPTPAGRYQVWIDGVPGAEFDDVGDPVWSSDGRLAYAARRGAVWSMIVDGRELPGGVWIGTPVFGSGGRLGYLRRTGTGWSAVVDGRDYEFELVIDETLVFSGDGRHWSVIAGDRKREELFFAIDGVGRVPLPAREVYSSAIHTSHLERPGAKTDNLLLRWSKAEADRAGAAHPE